MEKTKPFNIPKKLYVEAYKLVKANSGAAGVDHQSIADFEKDLQNNLYKLWNHMSSGCYFPTPVRAVPIAKKSGGERILGIPTVGDRICQMVAKLVFEPLVEPIFLPDSYGYRPNKSALDAIGVTRQRCWHNDWVLEFDIRGLFDNIPHDLLMKAVCQHTPERWLILCIERWLTAPMQHADGSIEARTKGTPQGGVVSPVLSNLFLHYVFDKWMQRYHPKQLWCRYADDGLVHCKTEQEAQQLLCELQKRFAECGLELHPDKTKIVYCKDGMRRQEYPNKSFDFPRYTFQARTCKRKDSKKLFYGFIPAASKAALKSMQQTTRKKNWRNRADMSLAEIARAYNPVLRGWLNYYGKYNRSTMYSVLQHFNRTLVAWAVNKYKSFRKSKVRAGLYILRITKDNPQLFTHWQLGMTGIVA